MNPRPFEHVQQLVPTIRHGFNKNKTSDCRRLQQQQSKNINSKKFKLKRRGSNKNSIPKQQQNPVICYTSWDTKRHDATVANGTESFSRICARRLSESQRPLSGSYSCFSYYYDYSCSTEKDSSICRIALVSQPPQVEQEETSNHSSIATLSTTPLHEAARMASSTLVRLFLQHNSASPNVRNRHEQTSLILAAGGLTQHRSYSTTTTTTRMFPSIMSVSESLQ